MLLTFIGGAARLASLCRHTVVTDSFIAPEGFLVGSRCPTHRGVHGLFRRVLYSSVMPSPPNCMGGSRWRILVVCCSAFVHPYRLTLEAGTVGTAGTVETAVLLYLGLDFIVTVDQILERLIQPGTSAEQLLDESRWCDEKLWEGNATLYRAFTEKLISQGHPARALELAREGHKALRDDIELQYLLVLAARRGGNPRYALALLEPLLPKAKDPKSTLPVKLRVDIVALQGGILKHQSRTDPTLLADSAQWYELAAGLPGAAEMPDKGTFPLINAATVWRLAGQRDRSRTLAREVIQRSAQIDLTKADPVWYPATLGEAHLLVEEYESSTAYYVKAIEAARSLDRLGELAAVRANIELLRMAGVTANPALLDMQLGSVVTFSGHMIDSPERSKAGHSPRFPNSPELIDAVAGEIRRKLDDLNAKVGFCSLACGGDLLFAQAMLARHAELHLILPYDEHDFLRTSVNFGQSTGPWRKWRAMFDDVLDRVPASRVRYATQEPFLGSNELYQFSNCVRQGLTVMRARERTSLPQAIVLQDSSMIGQSGGARDFAKAWTDSGYVIHEIDLGPLRTQHYVPSFERQPPATFAQPPAVSTLPRPVKSLLFADIQGFSKIPEWQFAKFLGEFGSFLRELFGSPIGEAATYANTWGDAIYAVFDSVADAAAFALELLEPTVATPPNWSEYEMGTGSPFRVGLHSGPVFELPDIQQGRSAFSGQHASRAARIEPATMRGCAYASEPFAALLTMEGDERFHIESAGIHALAKNYDRCQLYRIDRGTVVAS